MIRSCSCLAVLLGFVTALFLVGCQKDSLTGPTEASQRQGSSVRLLDLPQRSPQKDTACAVESKPEGVR